MWHDILKYILTTLIGAILAALCAYIKTLKNKVKATKDMDIVICESVKILLRTDIKRQCKTYIRKGAITVEEFEELTEAMNVYKALGGNGTAHALYDSLSKIVQP